MGAPVRTFDFRGKDCPEGYVLAMRALDSLKPGESCVVLMDSWKCAAMVVYSLANNRSVRFEVERSGPEIRFRFHRVS